jgi:hypothetical protein
LKFGNWKRKGARQENIKNNLAGTQPGQAGTKKELACPGNYKLQTNCQGMIRFYDKVTFVPWKFLFF